MVEAIIYGIFAFIASILYATTDNENMKFVFIIWIFCNVLLAMIYGTYFNSVSGVFQTNPDETAIWAVLVLIGLYLLVALYLVIWSNKAIMNLPENLERKLK